MNNESDHFSEIIMLFVLSIEYIDLLFYSSNGIAWYQIQRDTKLELLVKHCGLIFTLVFFVTHMIFLLW